MLQLYRNNIPVPTGRDFGLVIKWVNPCCFMDSLPGDAGLGITIPVNEWTKNIFGHPDRFEKFRSASDRTFPGMSIRFGGALLLSGTLKITGATPQQYDAWLQSDMGVVGESVRDVAIPDMVPEGSIPGWKENQTFSIKSSYVEGTDDYNPFPVINGAFWNGKSREMDVTITYTDEDGEEHKVGEKITYLTKKFRELPLNRTVNQISGGLVIATGESCVVSPFLFFRYVLKEIFRINKLFVDRNDMIPEGIDTSLTKYLLLYHNFNIMDQQLQYEPVDHSYYDHEAGTVVTEEEQQITSIVWSIGTFNYTDLLPRVTLKDFLIGIQNYLNYIFVFKPGCKIDIVDREAVMDPADGSNVTDLDEHFLGDWIIGEPKDVAIKFVSEFDKEDRMFGQEYHDLTGRIADFGDPVDTFTDLFDIANPVHGELRLVKDENKIYEYKWKVITYEDIMYRENQLDALGWEFVSSGPQPYLFGDSGVIEEIKTIFSTPQVTHNEATPLPVALQQGNISKMRSSWVDFTPRLINSNETLWPEALNWEGPNGLFEKRWKKWARFWKSRLPVEGTFNLPMYKLIEITSDITRKFRTRHGEFIIEEMETEFRGNLIGTTKIRGYKV